MSLDPAVVLSALHPQAARDFLSESLTGPQTIAPLPRVCAQLAQLTAQQATDATQLARLIQSDPVLAGEIMRVKRPKPDTGHVERVAGKASSALLAGGVGCIGSNDFAAQATVEAEIRGSNSGNEPTEAGWIWMHCYYLDERRSTCVVECPPETWRW